MKDGRTELAYKAEHAVDMETGAMVAVTAYGGATGDTKSIQETLPAAGEAMAEQIEQAQAQDAGPVHAAGVEEVVADKGYHSNEVLTSAQQAGVRTYIAEPQRGGAEVGRQARRTTGGVWEPAADSRRAG